MELDAVYMEDITYNQVNDCYNYLGNFFNEPEKSLMEYSCFIWGLYLAQKFDTSLMVAVWEGARYSDVFDALSDTLMGRYGWSQDSAFAEFVTWNYITGERDDNFHHTEASEYPLMIISQTHNYYPVALQNSAKSPTGYASCYVEFVPPGVPGTVLFKFDGADTRQWAAYLIKSLSVNQHVIEKIELDPVTNEGEIEVENFETYHLVTLVGANLSEFSSGANFSYEVEQVSLRSVASEVLTDSAVYSGGTREFEFRVINTAEDNDIFDIIVWDEYGWITPDTISRPMAAGLDTIFYIPVSSPQQTPLGETSTLYFMARSWGDPDVYDSVSHQAEAVLYRGDANFSGTINISDVTYLVAYLFGGGPVPQPVSLSGDYNCSETVNISDITNIVYYLFGSGMESPCNPY